MHKALAVPHDVRVFQGLQSVDFFDRLGSLLGAHQRDVHCLVTKGHLQQVVLVVLQVLDQHCDPETAFADDL